MFIVQQEIKCGWFSFMASTRIVIAYFFILFSDKPIEREVDGNHDAFGCTSKNTPLKEKLLNIFKI